VSTRLEAKLPPNSFFAGPWELYHPVHEMLNKSLNYYAHMFKGEPPDVPDWAKLRSEIEAFLAQHKEKLRFSGDSE